MNYYVIQGMKFMCVYNHRVKIVDLEVWPNFHIATHTHTLFVYNTQRTYAIVALFPMYTYVLPTNPCTL